MICETVTIGAVEKNCIWVEAAPKSACGACAARSGCGQRLLGKLMAKPNLVRVPLDAGFNGSLKVGDQVQVGVPEAMLVSASAILYLVPVLAMMVLSGAATVTGWNDWQVATSALSGLFLGAWGVHRYALRRSKDYSPVLINNDCSLME
ncbi:SoxR reducing system RseC family protein [Porticoccus sp. GXU_MW_L64]